MEIKFFSVPWTQDGEDKFDMTSNKLEDILASDNCQFLGSCEGGITYTTSLTANINIVIPSDFDIKSANYVYLPEKKEGWYLSDFRFMNGKTLQLTLEYDIWSNTFNWDCFLQTNAVNIQRQHCDRFVDKDGYPMDFNQTTSKLYFQDSVVNQYGELGYADEPSIDKTTFKTGVKELDNPVSDTVDSFDLKINSVIGNSVIGDFTNNLTNASIKYWNLTSYHIMKKDTSSYFDEKFYTTKVSCVNKDVSINRIGGVSDIFSTNVDVQAKNVRKLLPIGTEYVAHGRLPFTVKFLRLDESNKGVVNECVYVNKNGQRTNMGFGVVDGTQYGTMDVYLSWSPDTNIWGSTNQSNELNAWRAATIVAAQKLIGGANFNLGYGGINQNTYNSLIFSPENNINAMWGYNLIIPFGADKVEVVMYIEFNKIAWEQLDRYVTIYSPNGIEGNQKDYTTILDAKLTNPYTFKYKPQSTWNYLNEPRIYMSDIMTDVFMANNLQLNLPLFMNIDTVRMKETVPVTNQEFSLTALNLNEPKTNYNAKTLTQQQTFRVGSNGNNSLPLLKDTYAQTMSRQQSQINNQEKWGVISGAAGAATGAIGGMAMLGMGSSFYDHYLMSAEALTREKAGSIMGMMTGGFAGTAGSLVGGIVQAIRARDTKRALLNDLRRAPDEVTGQGGMIQINTSNQFRPTIYRKQLPDWAVQSLAMYFHKYGYKAPETKILYRVLEYKRKNFNYFEIEGMGDACVLNQTFKAYYNALFSQGVRIWWDCRKKMRDYTLPNNERFIEND